jgi:hypothetical protein
MDPAWREHLEALERFNDWEAEQLRNQPRDYRAALEWLSSAWELANRFGAHEPGGARRDRHMHQLLDLRAALARANLRA